MTADIIISFAISFVITVALGFVLIPMLRSLKAGQSIKRDGPIWHISKEGTPTMGGFMFIIAMLVVAVIFALRYREKGGAVLAAMFVFALVYGIIGFIDDFTKIRHKGNQGLTALQKFLLQLVVAVAFVLLLRYLGYLTPNLYIPFVKMTVSLGWVYYPFAVILLTGVVNSVNLTDGIDGLAASETAIVAAFFSAVAFTGIENEPLGIFAAAALGGCIGFLVYNVYPARVFMGDTGSLFLGALVVGMAFMAGNPLIVVIVGLMYIVETLSVMLQVTYFKLTHGKRLFKMSPIHHHFEKCGWSEVKIVSVFSGLTLLFAILAYAFDIH